MTKFSIKVTIFLLKSVYFATSKPTNDGLESYQDFEKTNMKKIYHLKTCNTCARIIKNLDVPNDVTFQDIKEEELTVKQLEELVKLAGSYESLFSRRAKLYKEMGLKDQNLTEADYKHYILDHYTFLKRPVIAINNQIFIGNSAKTLEAAKAYIHTHE